MCVEIKARPVLLSDSLLDYTECRWRLSLERLGAIVDSVVVRYHQLGAGSRAVTYRCLAVVHLVSGELLVLDGVDGDVYRGEVPCSSTPGASSHEGRHEHPREPSEGRRGGGVPESSHTDEVLLVIEGAARAPSLTALEGREADTTLTAVHTSEGCGQ